jgi:DNA topoisomerase-1
MTNLERLQTTGIRRLGKPERGFHYKSLNGGSVTKSDLERIKKLRIPPAWSNVAINTATNGRLQAIGQDAAGRWQYLYHESHNRAREAKKFRRLVKFAHALPKLRAAISRDLRKPGLSRERVLATVLRILSSCSMRPGSEVYASENGSYGIATLRRKHVRVKGDGIYFDFPGKSGVRQQRELHDRRIAKVVRSLLKQPGKRVFQFENENGQFVDVTSRHINQYIKEVMGESFSAKDFRTWAGTLICAFTLATAGTDETEKMNARKKKIVAAIKQTSEALGNTPAVCKSSYICPAIISSFEKGKIVSNCVLSLETFLKYRGLGLHSAERALVRFLRQATTSESRLRAVASSLRKVQRI